MPVTIRWESLTTSSQQAQIIPDATCHNDGVMTKKQACKLENMPDTGPTGPTGPTGATGATGASGGDCCPSITDVKSANYNAVAGEVVLVSVGDEAPPVHVVLPLAAGTKNKIITVKNVDDFPSAGISVDASGADNIDDNNTISISNPLESMSFISDGISTWWRIYF